MLKVWDKIQWQWKCIKIMAYCDWYYMARYKWALPFCIDEKWMQELVTNLL